MKQKDSNSLAAIHGGGCKQIAVIASVGAFFAVVTLNPVLMAVCAAATFANYHDCTQ